MLEHLHAKRRLLATKRTLVLRDWTWKCSKNGRTASKLQSRTRLQTKPLCTKSRHSAARTTKTGTFFLQKSSFPTNFSSPWTQSWTLLPACIAPSFRDGTLRTHQLWFQFRFDLLQNQGSLHIQCFWVAWIAHESGSEKHTRRLLKPMLDVRISRQHRHAQQSFTLSFGRQIVVFHLQTKTTRRGTLKTKTKCPISLARQHRSNHCQRTCLRTDCFEPKTTRFRQIHCKIANQNYKYKKK